MPRLLTTCSTKQVTYNGLHQEARAKRFGLEFRRERITRSQARDALPEADIKAESNKRHDGLQLKAAIIFARQWLWPFKKGRD